MHQALYALSHLIFTVSLSVIISLSQKREVRPGEVKLLKGHPASGIWIIPL